MNLHESNVTSDQVWPSAEVPVYARLLSCKFVTEDLYAFFELGIEGQYCELFNAHVPQSTCAGEDREIEKSGVQKLQTLDGPANANRSR